MHRAQLLIEDWQYETLKARAERQGRSISELVREILSEHLGRQLSSSGLDDLAGLVNDPDTTGESHDDDLYGPERR